MREHIFWGGLASLAMGLIADYFGLSMAKPVIVFGAILVIVA